MAKVRDQSSRAKRRRFGWTEGFLRLSFYCSCYSRHHPLPSLIRLPRAASNTFHHRQPAQTTKKAGVSFQAGTPTFELRHIRLSVRYCYSGPVQHIAFQHRGLTTVSAHTPSTNRHSGASTISRVSCEEHKQIYTSRNSRETQARLSRHFETRCTSSSRFLSLLSSLPFTTTSSLIHTTPSSPFHQHRHTPQHNTNSIGTGLPGSKPVSY